MNKKVLILFFLGLVVRLFVMFWGYHGDLNNNISWGSMGLARGLNGFYEYDIWSYSAPNQPPLYILLFVFLRAVWQWINELSHLLNSSIATFPSAFIWFWEDKGMMFMVKLPSILGDLALGLVIYNFVKKHKKNMAVLSLSLWLFNPVIWYNSAVWGQTDVLVNLLGVLGVISLINKNLVRTFAFFTLSFLFKGSLAIFVPVIGFIALRQKYMLVTWIKSVIVALFIVVLVSIPFHPHLDIFIWLYSLYTDRILPGEIGFLTANAFNFWWLIESGNVYDSIKFLAISARVWGYVISLALILPLMLKLKKPKKETIFFAFGLSALITFLFMSRIHERYLYPFFPMITILFAFRPRLIFSLLLLSLAHLLNLYHLFWVPNFTPLESLYLNQSFMWVLAVAHIGVFGLLYWSYFFGYNKQR